MTNSPEHNAKISAGLKRYHASRRARGLPSVPDDVRERMAAAKRGRKRKPFSAEHRARMAAAQQDRRDRERAHRQILAWVETFPPSASKASDV